MPKVSVLKMSAILGTELQFSAKEHRKKLSLLITQGIPCFASWAINDKTRKDPQGLCSSFK